ncbi:MAG: protein kinase domain-containing protein [Candidatus Helarchaeota archaeon]
MFESDEFIEAFKSTLESKGYIYLEPMEKSGEWGRLYFVYDCNYKEIRVVKVYKEPIDRINENKYISDARKLMKINNENVVKFIDYGTMEYEGNKFFFLIMEYIRGKSFEELDLRLFYEQPYLERLKFFSQFLDAINEFRKDFELHRDLHPGNVMLLDNVNIEKKIKVIDPGSSRYSFEPKSEDIDLYAIKRNIIELFLTNEEISNLDEEFDLKNLNFPKLRDQIKRLCIEEIEKMQYGKLEEGEDQERINSLIEQLDKERRDCFETIEKKDPLRKHILISFDSIPVKLNHKKIDFKNSITVDIIKNVYKEVNYKNPYGGMNDFSYFLQNFEYMGDCYKSEFLRNTSEIYNFGRVKIFKDGIISIIIAFQAFKVGIFPEYSFYSKHDESIRDSLSIDTKLLIYLILNWLKLIKIIYLKLNLIGKLKLSLNIYSNETLSLTGNVLKLGSSLNPKSELDINIKDLKDNDKILEILRSFLKELVRYFGIDIDDFNQKYELIFSKIVDSMFDRIFNS